MSAHEDESPVRTVYDALSGEPLLTESRYRRLIDALRPLWIEEVVCPIHVAVRSLGEAAAAAAAGDEPGRHGAHEAAHAVLYEALSTARLLTLEERLQEVTVSGLLGEVPVDGGTGARPLRAWDGWRAH